LKAQFGIKPVQSWEGEGFGDTDIGARYQYYRGELLRAAFTGGARLPTGKVDDPDNLVDVPLGNGAYALLFRLNQDVMFQPDGLGKRLGFPEPWTGFINTTISYDAYLPSKQELRVCSPDFPVCSAKEKVDRKVGDLFEAEVSGRLGVFFNGLIFSPLFRYDYKFKDHNNGSNNLDYGSLATNTNLTSYLYIMSLTYSTIPMVAQKQFYLPLSVSVNYRNRFAGENINKSQYVGFTVQVYF
jgi:hypothetical protein